MATVRCLPLVRFFSFMDEFLLLICVKSDSFAIQRLAVPKLTILNTAAHHIIIASLSSSVDGV